MMGLGGEACPNKPKPTNTDDCLRNSRRLLCMDASDVRAGVHLRERLYDHFRTRFYCVITRAMRKTLLALSFITLVCTADMHSTRAAEIKPRIRAVTAFIEIDPNNYAARVAEAQKFLATAKDALNKAGFEGAGGRITTQPFPQYTKGMTIDEAVGFIGKLREAAQKERSALNIASAMVHDND